MFTKCFQSAIICVICLASVTNSIKVTTELGVIVGKEVAIKIAGIDFTINTFFGIPYAKPPIGNLRFKKPEPIGLFREQVNASVTGPACMQRQPGTRMMTISEDCLTLNIYTPGTASSDPDGHAVMVYIHGGGFDTGTGSDFSGTNLVLGGNVIVVTLNYRLGFFGFMSTGDAHAPGNLGLWDQRLAIQWVHAHIDRFGGDRSRVVLLGQSAGATSVLLQGLNPRNAELFHGIISQSMSSFRWNVDMGESQAKTVRVAEKLNCNTTPSRKMLECLRSISAQDILTRISRLIQPDPTPYELRFLPRIDNDFIEINPTDLNSLNVPTSKGKLDFFRSLNFLGGFNDAEGALYLSQWPGDFGDPETFEPSRDKINEVLIPKSLNLFYSKDYNEALKQQVIAEYTDWSIPGSPQLLRQQYVKLLGDLEFCVPIMQLSLIHAGIAGLENNKTFVYHFTSPPENIRVFPRPSWVTGANHADELLFLIGLPNPSNWEYILISSMVTYWTNFAKSGNPNIPTRPNPSWPGFSTTTRKAIVLDNKLTLNATKRDFYSRETNFWLVVVPITEKLTSADKCPSNKGLSWVPDAWLTSLVSLTQLGLICLLVVF